MKAHLFKYVILFCMSIISTVQAVELNYKWEKEKLYRYSITSTDKISMSSMGINMNKRFNTNSTFAIKITDVGADASAEGHIIIEKFKVMDAKGNVMASLASLPPDALSNQFKIDSKGNFMFQEIVYLIIDEEEENFLVSGNVKVNANSAEASGQIGDEQVTLCAKFDPKTGHLSAGYSIKKIKKKVNRKKIAVKQDKPRVDILPTRFLELLLLPEGSVQADDVFKSNIGGVTVVAKVNQLKEDQAIIQTTVSTKESKQESKQHVSQKSSQGGEMFNMNLGMEMNMGGMSSSEKALMPKMGINGKFLFNFDPRKGQLMSISGNIKNKLNMGSMMVMKTDSQLEMKFINK